MPRQTRAERRTGIEDALLAAIERHTEAGTKFSAILVNDLVAEAGISRSTFYLYFEHKSDLLLAWFSRFIHALEDDATWWARSPDFTRADLRRSLGRLCERYRERAVLMHACHELAAHDVQVRLVFADSYERTRRKLRTHIRVGQRDGWVNPALNPDSAAMWLTCMMERGLSDIASPAGDRELDAAVDAVTQVVWRTLYSPP